MEHRNLPPFLVIFGVGIVIVASLGFVLSSLAGGARDSEPEATLALATRMPVATSAPVPAPTTAPAAGPPWISPSNDPTAARSRCRSSWRRGRWCWSFSSGVAVEGLTARNSWSCKTITRNFRVQG
jgi:hypothetical protein